MPLMKWYYVYDCSDSSYAHKLLADINPQVRERMNTPIAYFLLSDEDVLLLTLGGLVLDGGIVCIASGMAYGTYAEFEKAGGLI